MRARTKKKLEGTICGFTCAFLGSLCARVLSTRHITCANPFSINQSFCRHKRIRRLVIPSVNFDLTFFLSNRMMHSVYIHKLVFLQRQHSFSMETKVFPTENESKFVRLLKCVFKSRRVCISAQTHPRVIYKITSARARTNF